MTRRIDIYKESFLIDINRDVNTRLKELDEFISILINLTDKLHDAKVSFEFWRQYLEVLIVKFTLHSASLSHIIKGTPLNKENKQIIYPDLGSIYLLARAQIESYLMFYYLNIQPKSNSEGQFRFFIYELSGLQQRQDFPSSEKYSQKKLDEKEQIKDLIEKIKSNDYFKNLSAKEQAKFISKKVSARLTGWESLIKDSHLKSDIFVHLWKLYSNYAHSEMISAIQIRDYVKNYDQMNQTIYMVVKQSLMLVCVSIFDIKNAFKSSEFVLNTYSSDLLTKIEMWNNIAKKNNGM